MHKYTLTSLCGASAIRHAIGFTTSPEENRVDVNPNEAENFVRMYNQHKRNTGRGQHVWFPFFKL